MASRGSQPPARGLMRSVEKMRCPPPACSARGAVGRPRRTRGGPARAAPPRRSQLAREGSLPLTPPRRRRRRVRTARACTSAHNFSGARVIALVQAFAARKRDRDAGAAHPSYSSARDVCAISCAPTEPAKGLSDMSGSAGSLRVHAAPRASTTASPCVAPPPGGTACSARGMSAEPLGDAPEVDPGVNPHGKKMARTSELPARGRHSVPARPHALGRSGAPRQLRQALHA